MASRVRAGAPKKLALGAVVLGRLDGLCVLVRQALAEALDALGDIAHQLGNLAPTSEEDHHEGSDDEPMPNREGTHSINLCCNGRRSGGPALINVDCPKWPLETQMA